MSENMQQLYEERLGRYQGAICFAPIDRVPIAVGSNTFAETYAGTTKQEVLYDPQKWLEGEITFCRDFPEVDVLRNSRFWAPMFDAIGLNLYKFPGRDLPPEVPVQFVEVENMLADEYDELIRNPALYMMERFLPRVCTELTKGPARSQFAMLKAGLAQAQLAEVMRNRSVQLQTQCGMPQPMTGAFMAPFDVLGDTMRGMQGIFKDIMRQPEKVLEACEVLTPIMMRFAVSSADPLRRYPIFVPTHKPMFMSPKNFDKFYWPSFKKTLLGIIEAGHRVRCYMEGDWSKHWHHFLELPKGSMLLDLDDPADNIFKAKKEIGHHMAIAGGISSTMFVLGTPDEMTARVKQLCETVAADGGYILSGPCYIPQNTKVENYRAMIEAAMTYGWYSKDIRPKPLAPLPITRPLGSVGEKEVLTSWAQKKAELGGVTGSEELIKAPWESIEQVAFNWLWNWIF